MESDSSPTDTEVPWQRLRRISLLFVVVSKLRQWIIPVIVGLFSARQGSYTLIGLGILAFAILLAFAIVRYLTLQFRLADGELQIRDGIIFRSNRTVPVNRIQNIDLVQNLLHRIFRVAEVRIETASGKEPEAILQVLSLDDVERLRASVFAQSQTTSPQPPTIHSIESTESSSGIESDLAAPRVTPLGCERTEQVLHSLTFKHLALAGLTSNRGLLLVPIAIGAIYEVRNLTGISSFSEPIKSRLRVQTKDIWELMPNGLPTVNFVLWVLAGLFVAFLCLKLFSIAWFVIRFYDYQLKLVGNDLRIGCGLFTKVSATVPRSRIQFISIHRSWLGRKLGLASIRIETAGGGGNENENASQSVARRWFVPVLWESQVAGLVEQLRPGIEWTESRFDWRPLSPLAGKRIGRFAMLATLILTLVSAFVWRPWGAAVGIVLLPIFLWAGWRTANAMRYARTNSLVLFRSGLLTRKVSCAFTDKIQALRLSQSPFDRRWQMATLALDTAAAGPAEHRIQVRYMDAAEAQREFADLKRVSSCLG